MSQVENPVDISDELRIIEKDPRGKAVKDAIYDALVKLSDARNVDPKPQDPSPPGSPKIIKTLDTIAIPDTLLAPNNIEFISPYNIYPPSYGHNHPSPNIPYNASFSGKSYPYLGVIVTFSPSSRNRAEYNLERRNYPSGDGWRSLIYDDPDLDHGDIELDDPSAKDDKVGQTATAHHQLNYFDVYWQYSKYGESKSTGFTSAGTGGYCLFFHIPYAKSLELVDTSILFGLSERYYPPPPTGKPRIYIIANCGFKPNDLDNCWCIGGDEPTIYGRSIYPIYKSTAYPDLYIWYDCQPDLHINPAFGLLKGENWKQYEDSYGADSFCIAIDVDYENELTIDIDGEGVSSV